MGKNKHMEPEFEEEEKGTLTQLLKSVKYREHKDFPRLIKESVSFRRSLKDA